MKYALGNMLNGAGGLNPDQLALDLQFAADKTLTARKGPTPVFSRGSSGTFVNADGLIVGKTAGTTASITPSTQAIGSQVTVTVASDSVVGWVVGQAVSLIVDTDGQDDPDATELWLLGNIVSTTATQLVFQVTSRTAQAGSATIWTLGYRGPRFDHDPVTLASRGLLIEESRTNQWSASEDLGASPWSLINTTTPNSNNTISPDGLTTADMFTVGSTTQEYGFFRNTFLFVSGTTYTISCYLKANQVTRVSIYGLTQTTLPVDAYFDLTGNGSVTANASGTASIQRLANGWYRCVITGTALASAVTSVRINAATTGNSRSYPGNSVDSFYAWGAQLEAGSFATSYIPTTTGALTRSADVCSITGGDFTNLWNTSEGTMFGDFSMVNGYSITGRSLPIFWASNGTFNDSVRISSSTGSLSPVIDSTISGTLTRAISSVAISLSSRNKTAGAYKVGDNGISTNGSVVVTSSPAAISTLPNRIDIGGAHPGSGVSPLNGHLAAIRYYKKRLPNAKLVTLTT